MLYSCDQTASQVQELQSKTLASHEQKSLPNYKRRNILVMILACCNTSSGNLKLKTAFVGNPESLMPSKIWFQQHFLFVCEYEWTQDIFEVRFDQICTFNRMLFAIKKNLERKVVPVTDNASSFPSEKELHHGKVKVIFLP